MPRKASGATKGYPSTPHLPFSPGVQVDDTKLADCPWLVGHELVVTEKLDGGNCCLWRGGVYARTHSHEAKHPWFASIKALYPSFAARVDDDLMLFGENMSVAAWPKGPRSQQPMRLPASPVVYSRKREPSPLGCRGEAAAALWCLPTVRSPIDVTPPLAV